MNEKKQVRLFFIGSRWISKYDWPGHKAKSEENNILLRHKQAGYNIYYPGIKIMLHRVMIE